MATLFPQGGRAIVEAMCAKFPELHVNEDDKQRELTTRINQQFCFQFGKDWGGKVRAGLDPEAFRSKDSQAVREADGSTSVWDLFQGNAAVTILVQDGDPPTHPNLGADAEFIDVIARDWLEGGGDPGGGGEPPDDELEARVVVLEKQVATLTRSVADLTHIVQQLNESVRILATQLADLNAHALKDTDTLKVQGRTGTAGASFLAHSHPVDLPVTRVQ